MLDKPGKRHDVFLSYNSADKEMVAELATRLREVGLSVFLDTDNLSPGEPWMRVLEAGLLDSRAFVVCVGSSGLGRWTEREVDVALDQVVREPSLAIIPVLLPGASRSQQDELSLFLRQYQFLDLRRSLTAGEGFDRLAETLLAIQGSSYRQPKYQERLSPAIIEPALERLQSRFSESIRHHLAGGQIIRRKETQELLDQLDEETTRVVVVHGIAGSGKSGVLFELAEQLADQTVPFMPLRLDRYQLEGDPQQFGKNALGLPNSPAKCLAAVAGEKGGVLLLDQLDALRWTSAHSSEAWDVCREVISEALLKTTNLKVVVCCRTFDLDHDPQLRGWEQETKNLRRIEVQPLSTEEVTYAIRRATGEGKDLPPLRPKEQDLLRHIHHLQMWIAIYKSTENAPTFDTSWSLMEQFWANRRDELAKAGIQRDRSEELERRFVEAMERGILLSAPTRKLDMSQKELELYQHYHLIQVDASRRTFTFCHQSYQDYLIAKSLLSELDQCVSEEGGHKVLSWLGNRERQSLFRREQLRLLLGALRGEEHQAYLPILRELLQVNQPAPTSPVRFHLRLLALQLLGQVTDPRPEEFNLVFALFDNLFWRKHVIAEVLRGQASWFNELDRQGKLETWLTSEDRQLRELVLDMMLYVVDKCGDQVARLFAPYVKDEAWTNQIIWVLRFDPSQDSDALFELRLQLAKNGSYTADHVDWSKLAQNHPIRFVLLAAYVLMAFAVSISQGKNRRRPGRRAEIDWHSLEKVSPTVMPFQHWAATWAMLFRSLSLVTQVRSYPTEPQYVLESYSVDFETLRPVLRLLKDFGRALLNENWLEFVTLGEELSQLGRHAEVLFIDSLVEGPTFPEFADWVLGWLMADPWRLQLRLRQNSEISAGLLLERFSPACSPEIYNRLEQWLLTYREPDLLENYKHRHDWIGRQGDLTYFNSFGKTPHALLPKLPIDRRSAKVEARLKELNRKFPLTSSSDGKDNDITVGWVGSPLSDDARARMSDEDWIAIATNENLPARWGKTRVKSSGQIAEASIETFATEFRNITQRQPERFARLALRLPLAANTAFLSAILSGLAWPGDQRIEGWTPPSHAVLEEVLMHPAVQMLARREDLEAAKNLCRIFARYSEYSWSDSAIEFLAWIAQHHSDPKHGYYPVGTSNPDGDGFNKLETNALNVTRGAAGFAIRELLFKQQQFFDNLRPAMESLIRDEHPAVRVGAIAACLPVIKIDRDLAVDWLLQACKGPDSILGTREVWDVLRYTYRDHLDQLRPLIERMVTCSHPSVATAGAAQIAAYFLVVGQLEEEFERCLFGTPPQRKGVAEVAASLIGESEFAEKAKETLLRLANDKNEQVAQAVASSFEQLDLRHITSDRNAWNDFARSKAFQTDPSHLLRALDRQVGSLLPFADCLLAVGTTFAEELAEASQDMRTGISGDARELLPLLLRLYEEVQSKDQILYLRCLDLWDRLLERRVGAAMGLTKELDRV